jgi:DNA-binding PadR family transcriptional regulator
MAKGDLLGEFELCVLLAVTHLGDEAYGVAIRQLIAKRTGRETAIGAVYATLARLHDKRLVTFTLSDPDPVPGGRARKCFTLTADGHTALRQSTTILSRMLEGWSPKAGRSS